MKPGKLIRTIDGQIIGERNGWVLFIRAGKSTQQWTSLKLLRRSPGKARKNAFWLGGTGNVWREITTVSFWPIAIREPTTG